MKNVADVARGSAEDVAGEAAGGARALLVCLCVGIVLTRLPQLSSPHLLLDGDEAVLSLMARRAARLEWFPLYFDGQKYGFSSLETALAALGYGFVGAQTLVIKVAMLALFAAGSAWLCLALDRLAGRRAAWIGAALIVCCPGWGVWSMKARGGYLTAFLLTSICRWILACERPDRRSTFALGLCASGAMVAQPIFFLALGPWLAAFAWRRRLDLTMWFDAFAGATVTLVLIVFPGIFRSQGSWSPSLMNAPSLVAAARALPETMLQAFGGANYLRYTSGELAFRIPGIVWLVAGVLAAVWVLRARGSAARVVAQRATLLGALAVVAFATPTLTPRYLLPAMDALVFVLALQLAGLAESGKRGASIGATLFLAATGLVALISYRGLVFAGDGVTPAVPSESAALDATLEHLANRGVVGVYTLDPLLQWIVIDRSAEELPARWKAAEERTPVYIDRFAHLASSGGRLALLAYARQRPVLEAAGPTSGIVEVAERYLVVLDPSPELLDALGFE